MSRPRLLGVLVLGIASLAIGLGAAAAATTFTASRTFPTRGSQAIRVDFPAGDLIVSAADDSEITATMTARCRHGRKCAERAERIRLVSSTRGRTVVLKLEGLPKLGCGSAIELRLVIPRSLATTIEMGAGDLEVRGLAQDIHVNMGAGDVTIHAPQEAVGSVAVHVGIGDATLRRHHDRIEGSGFLSKHLKWSEGPGQSHVVINLGVGDVGVALD